MITQPVTQIPQNRSSEVNPTDKRFPWQGLDEFERMALRVNHTTMIQHYHDPETNTTHIGEKTNWPALFDAIEAKLRTKNQG